MNSCCTARETAGSRDHLLDGRQYSVKDSLTSGPFLLHLWFQPPGKQNVQKPNIRL